MRGKKRPLDERARAMGIAVVAGAPEASKATGIPANTIYAWMQTPEYTELRDRKKDDVAAEWWAGVQAYQRSIMEDLHSASVRDKVGAFAIMFEKLSLLRGDVTARSEVNTFHGRNDHEREAIADLLREALEGDSEPGGDQGVPIDAAVERSAP